MDPKMRPQQEDNIMPENFRNVRIIYFSSLKSVMC